MSYVITDKERQLASELLPHFDMKSVAKKINVPLYALAQSTLECDFPMSESLFNIRLRGGRIQLTDMDIEKRCPRCDEYYPFTLEFWHRANTKNDGAHAICRACEQERKAIWRRSKGQVPRETLNGEIR